MPRFRFLLLASLACATPLAVRAQTVNVQLIDVCDDSGNNCALSGPYAKYSYDPAATPAEIQKIFNQAGITVNLLAPVRYDSTAFLNPAVIDDPSHGYLTGSPTDPAHLLLSAGGHMQNTDPNVLDVYVVNSLPHNPDGTGIPTGSTLFGLGLQNSNGAIVATAPSKPDASGIAYVAGIDNIAHELAHNLGLLHVDGTADSSPYNLMQGTGRYVPQTVCGISGVSCDANGTVVAAGSPAVATTGRKDTLAAGQITQIRASAASLFSANGAMAFADASADSLFAPCRDGVGACAVNISVNQGPSTESLVGVKLRFRPSTGEPTTALLSSPFMPYFSNDACGAKSSSTQLADGTDEVAISFTQGCFTGPITYAPGISSAIYLPFFSIPVIDPNFVDVFRPVTPDYDLQPFSVQFTFADGTTTTSLFDSSGTASSADPVAVANLSNPDQTGPGLFVSTDPALFNAASVPEDEATFSVLPDGSALPLYTDVPEPGSFLLLGTGLVGLVARRR